MQHLNRNGEGKGEKVTSVGNRVNLCCSDKEVRVEVARQREMKWLDMFGHWDKWIKHRFMKVGTAETERCRAGSAR